MEEMVVCSIVLDDYQINSIADFNYFLFLVAPESFESLLNFFLTGLEVDPTVEWECYCFMNLSEPLFRIVALLTSFIHD